jgi:hypothetical protein
MSHFFTIVIINEEEINAFTYENAQNYITEPMEPYSENIEVEPYEKECYCIHSNLSNAVMKQLEKENLFIEDIHNRFNTKFKESFVLPKAEDYEDKKLYSDAIMELVDGRQKLWEEFSKEYMDRKEQLHKELKEGILPDPDCEDCNGTGIEISTYNPQSKWDWYCIGGRWDGAIKNLETIDDGIGGFNFGPAFHTVERNIIKVDDISKDISVFAIVTPDGIWHEKGKMLSFAMVDNEKEQDKWQTEVRNILNQYKDKIAIGVDCHI